jgi:hypothetical protein
MRKTADLLLRRTTREGEFNADITFSPKAGSGMSVRHTTRCRQRRGSSCSKRRGGGSGFSAIRRNLLERELETQHTFFVRNGGLFGLKSHHAEFALVPTIKDQFSSGEWYAPRIKFVRDSAGAIAGVTMGGGRVSAVKFTRKPQQ